MNLALLSAECRRAAPVMLLPVAIVGVAGAWRALTPGLASWDLAGDALLDSVRGSGPVAAGLTAWLTITSERSGLGRLDQLGRRSAAAGPLTRLGVAASAALTGYALTAGAIAAWTGAHGPITGSFQPQELAAGAAALLVHVTAGFLVAVLCCARRYPRRAVRGSRLTRSNALPAAGRLLLVPGRLLRPRLLPRGLPPGQLRTQRPRQRLRSRRLPRGRLLPRQPFPAGSEAVATAAIPVAAAMACWALAAWSGTRRSSGAGLPCLLLSPDVHHSPFTEWRSGLFAAALTWFCGLAAAAILAAALVLTRRHRYAMGLAAASIVAVLGLGQLRADAGHPITAVSASVVCHSWPLEVCVNPAFVAALPRLESAFTGVAAQVSGTPAAVRTIIQLPPGANESSWPGGYGFHLDDLGPGYELRAESDLIRQVTGALNRANRDRTSADQTDLDRKSLSRAPLSRAPLSRGPLSRGPLSRATLNRQPVAADIGPRVRSRRSRTVTSACHRYLPYAGLDGLELADMCPQGAHHLRPGGVRSP
jgi:hypothetical protein